ncbi:MAG: molybdenum cofactor biosynthesis protein MoaE [Proteobacteria bacterium]|nr:molybdenum cofactor biosynthesis protein MoaE [Pseudomonadota bacterium]
MAGKIYVEISETPLDIAAAHELVADPAHGAVDSFVGAVRDKNFGRSVLGVSYDVYQPLAENTLQNMCEQVRGEYGGEINIYIGHYKGRLPVGGISVIIAVSTPHRAESFSACRALIEELKRRAPIWKQEHYADGDSEWVQGHALCQHSHEHKHKQHAHG